MLFPCELISRNGEVLRGVVDGLARGLGAGAGFFAWLNERCIWACSLVDRIVSEALDPIGAVAEPYALWAIQDGPGVAGLPASRPGGDRRTWHATSGSSCTS